MAKSYENVFKQVATLVTEIADFLAKEEEEEKKKKIGDSLGSKSGGTRGESWQDALNPYCKSPSNPAFVDIVVGYSDTIVAIKDQYPKVRENENFFKKY